jgi:L-threonylcarbamoyladenylate synthase
VSARRPRLLDGDDRAIAAAAAHLAAGGLVAFPTETVYGLGADGGNAQACARVYAVKGRPPDNPLIVHFADAEAVFELVGRPGPLAMALAARFWPGPLTLVLPRPAGLLEAAAAGLDTVGVRVPDHPVAHALLSQARVPVAAPSANLSGRPSPTDAASVVADLEAASRAGTDLADVWVVDGGRTTFGIESTVIDLTAPEPCLLRAGALGVEAVEMLAGAVRAGGDLRRSPGTRYRHYAPALPLWLFDAATPTAAIADFVRGRPGPAALLASEERALAVGHALGAVGAALRVCPLGGSGDREGRAMAHDLFAALRWCESAGVLYALAELPAGDRGLAPAVRDRLLRAAGGQRLPATEGGDTTSEKC